MNDEGRSRALRTCTAEHLAEAVPFRVLEEAFRLAGGSAIRGSGPVLIPSAPELLGEGSYWTTHYDAGLQALVVSVGCVYAGKRFARQSAVSDLDMRRIPVFDGARVRMDLAERLVQDIHEHYGVTDFATRDGGYGR